MLKRLLLILILLAGSVRAATIVNLTPTVFKVAVGVNYCLAYFHYPNYKWDFEMACFDQGGTPQYIQVNLAGFTSENNVRFSDGSEVNWLLVPTATGYQYQLSGQGPTDAAPTLISGNL